MTLIYYTSKENDEYFFATYYPYFTIYLTQYIEYYFHFEISGKLKCHSATNSQTIHFDYYAIRGSTEVFSYLIFQP